MSLAQNIAMLRRLIHTITDKLAWLPPLAVRISLGVVFINTGWGKLHSLDDVTSFFTELGIPLPGLNAAFVSSLEFGGGLLLLLGLLSRVISVPLMGTMVVAILTAKLKDVAELNDLLGLNEWLYLVMFMGIAIGGPGAVSLDHVIAKRLPLQVPHGPAKRTVDGPLPAPTSAPNA
jgi:putative oxidoreductase